MKRFSAREFTLLCLPVAAVAGAGFWATRRGPLSAPDDGKPKLVFRVEQPATLKAFDGVKAVVVASMTPDTTRFFRRTDYCVSGPVNADVWIDVKTPQGTKTWHRSAKGSFPSDAFEELLNCNYYLFMRQVPQGETTLRFKGAYVPSGIAWNKAKSQSIPVRGQWTMDKSLIKPFDFSRPRVPEVELRSVKVSDVNKSGINVTALFVLTGKNASLKTPFETQSTMSKDWFVPISSSLEDNTPKERPITFMLSASPNRKGKMPKFTDMTGRVSANNNWPLLFKVEPFEFHKVKMDQQLKFKSWPAPSPSDAVLNK